MTYAHHYSKLRLTTDERGRYYVQFYLGGKRYRYAHGNVIGVSIKPNQIEGPRREMMALDLLTAFKSELDRGWDPSVAVQKKTIGEALSAFVPSSSLSVGYQAELIKTCRSFQKFVNQKRWGNVPIGNLKRSNFLEYLQLSSSNPSHFNHERARLSSILTTLLEPMELPNPVGQIKRIKIQQSMHKPFADVQAVFNELEAFNEKLFLCCLLTYGCLLRPHREIRQLRWGDFSEDFSVVSLSGHRNKSGRNRVVPVSPAIRPRLQGGDRSHNIFTNLPEPHNAYYFKTLWQRYRKHSLLLEPNQTLYSFRHTGAIEIFKRTGSMQILQQAMGHASIGVTLGYLRNLDVPQLTEDMMPSL